MESARSVSTSTPGATSPRTLTWQQPLPQDHHSQTANVLSARSLVESRPPGTLAEEVARLEEGTYRYDDPDTVALSEALQKLARDIVEAVGRRDPLFAGTLDALVGSHGDGTDVRPHVNEFDILVSVTVKGVRVLRVAWKEKKKTGIKVVRVKRREGRRWGVWVTGEALAACRKDRGRRSVLRGERPGGKSVLRGEVEGMEGWEVDPELFLGRWADGLRAVLPTVTLPEGLAHDGPLSPRYAGLKVGTTTATLFLVWQGKTRVTCDLTAAFPVSRDPLKEDTHGAICRLEEVAGLERSTHPVHLVPGEEGWLPTTCVIETRALVKLGPRSTAVTLIRGLKLLARRYLKWHHLDMVEMEVAEAKNTLAALVGGYKGPRGCIVGLVDVEDLSECVRESLETGKLRLPKRRVREGEGENEEIVYWSRVALVVTATHTSHWAGRGAVVCECGLCVDLTHAAEELSRNSNALHPAVREAVGMPPHKQLEVISAFLKYLVLSDLLVDEAGDMVRRGDVARGDVDPYMRALATYSEGVFPLSHPLLCEEGVRGIFPRTSTNPSFFMVCNAEVCRKLCDIAQVP